MHDMCIFGMKHWCAKNMHETCIIITMYEHMMHETCIRVCNGWWNRKSRTVRVLKIFGNYKAGTGTNIRLRWLLLHKHVMKILPYIYVCIYYPIYVLYVLHTRMLFYLCMQVFWWLAVEELEVNIQLPDTLRWVPFHLKTFCFPRKCTTGFPNVLHSL